MPRLRLKDYLNDPALLMDINTEEMRQWAAEVPYSGIVQRLLAQKILLEDGTDQKEIDHARAMVILSNANPDQALNTIEDFKEYILSGKLDAQNNEPPPVHAISEASPEDISTSTIVTSSKALPTDRIEELRATAFDEVDVIDPAPIQPEDAKAELAEYISSLDELDDENIRIDVPSASVTSEEMNPSEQTPAVRLSETTTSIKPSMDTHLGAVSSDEASSRTNQKEFFTWLADLHEITDEEPIEAPPSITRSGVISESLAEVLVGQGHVSQAIDMYEALILKYPEKSSFFAGRIKALKAS